MEGWGSAVIKKCLWRLYETPKGKKVVKEELAQLGPGETLLVAAMRRYRNNELFGYEHETLGHDLHALRAFGEGGTYRLTRRTWELRGLGLLAYQKKSRRVPVRLIALARARLRSWEKGLGE